MEPIKRFFRFLTAAPEPGPYGILARFESPAELVRAAAEVRKAGYRRFDTYSPFPIHGISKAMGLNFSLVPFLVLGGGVTGCLGGFVLQTWINVVDYPLVVSDKPYFSLPAFIPVIFELTILLAAFGAVGGMFAVNLLPMLYHPLLKKELFRRVTDDGFFLAIQARDKRFDPVQTRRLLESLGGQNIDLVEP